MANITFLVIYLIVSILLCGISLFRFYKNRLMKHYYMLRYPERLIRIMMHYPNGMYRIMYRLIPENRMFKLDDGTYVFDPKKLSNADKSFISRDDKDNYTFKYDKKTYNLLEEYKIKNRFDNIQEIHYNFNNPVPIDFNSIENTSELTADELTKFQQSDLFTKLLTLAETNKIMMIVIVMVIINMLLTAAILAKEFGLLDKYLS